MKKILYPLAVILILPLLYRCERKEDFNHLYLKDHSLVRSYAASNISSKLLLLEAVYPEIASLEANISYGARVYSISYKTTFLGEEITASGLVSIPDTEGSFPIISFQNGTNTCHSNAPSVNPNNTLYSLLSMNAGLGFIIAIPDYIGFGESEEFLHLYFHTESNNQLIRDMIHAVEELTDYNEGLSTNKDLYLMGYSQGGWATLAALNDLEQYQLEDYNLKAASCGAGAYDLIDFTHHIISLETFPNPFYFPYYIESRRQNGIIDDPTNLFFKEPYASLIPGLFDGSLCNSELNTYLTDTISNLLSDNLISGFDYSDDFIQLRNELLSSSIIPWKINTPVLLAHSNGDQSVPVQQSVNMYDDLLAAGTEQSNIDFLELDDLLHNEAIIPWGIHTLLWFLN